MKELTIEEKAKRYDKAIERAKEALNSGSYDEETIGYIFAELKESENEKIKKAILWCITTVERELGCKDAEGFAIDKLKSWLEKQGAKISVYKDTLFKIATILSQYEDKEDSPLEKIRSIMIDGTIRSMGLESKKEKQGEQKTTDKVEPKFKVGDYLVNDYCKGKVIALTDDAYLLDTGQGIPFSCEHNVHLWTIQDAKDGDVLAFDKDTIVIFKDLYNAITFHSYCHIEDGMFDFSKDELPDWWEGEGFKPATKGQRNLLFKKMKEAGYEWDTEKKELSIIEQKPTDEEMKILLQTEYEKGRADAIEQKSAWSEEDDIALNDALWCCKQAASIAKDENDMGNIWYAEKWLKLLKDRVQPQPKQEWSEEDEEMVECVIEAIDTNYAISDYNEMVDWLKSLKDRYTWKPSEQQIQALEYQVNSTYEGSWQYRASKELLEQLKKL